MYFTTVAALSTLLTTATLAAPTRHTRRQSNSGTFTLTSSNGGVGNPALNGVPIVANNHGFYINRNTTTDCPGGGQGCPVGDTTAVVAYGNGSLGLDVIVAGGQNIYIDLVDFSLNFTVANSPAVPAGSLITTFQYTAGTESTFGDLEFSPGNRFPEPDSFLACPVGDGSWSVNFNNPDKTWAADCEEIGIATYQYSGNQFSSHAAYEYC